MKKIIFALTLLMLGAAAWAQTVGGLIVTVDDVEQQFALNDIKEITFTDEGLTLVKTDDVSVEFPADWLIRFGDLGGIKGIDTDASDSVAQIYDTEGKLIMQGKISGIDLGQLPKGIYIIKCNGKSLKIMR